MNLETALQDGDLKYMVAFASPATAVAWCLVMQEALMYAEWPDAALRFDKFRTVHDDDGTLLFRGPRCAEGS